MAKKIRIDMDELNKSKKHNVFSYIVCIIAICSLIANGILWYNLNVKEKNYKKLEVENSKLSSQDNKCENNCLVEKLLYKPKAEFLDENIAFQIEGFGNYYYDYDCFESKTSDGKSYSYWAYNVEAAKANGLKKGTC